jgi:integrase
VALRLHREQQEKARMRAGETWQDLDLVFTARRGTALNAGNVRRAFRTVLKKTDINPDDWTPREMRHSFVSLLSDSGMPLENISRLVGHGTTIVTETVYRRQLRAV